MKPLISVNFVPGSHGNFLKQLLDLVFAERRWSKSPVTAAGTWHLHITDKELCKNAPPQKFQKHHYYRNADVLPDFIDRSSWAVFSDPAINITVETIQEKILISMYFARVGDDLPLSAIEISELNMENFIYTWILKNKVDVPDLPYLPYRLHLFEDVLRDVYQFKNTVPNEIDVIKFWSKDITRIDRHLDASAKFLESSKHTIYHFRMIWLYNHIDCLNAIREISNQFNIPILVSDDEIRTTIDFFKSTIKELPNMDLAQQKFDAIVGGIDVTLLDLDINSKIFLWLFLQHHYSLLDQSAITEWPSTSIEMRDKISSALNTSLTGEVQ